MSGLVCQQRVSQQPLTGDEGQISATEQPQTKQALYERTAEHATNVAAEHFPELSVEMIRWETSSWMQRSAGVAIYDHYSSKSPRKLCVFQRSNHISQYDKSYHEEGQIDIYGAGGMPKENG